MFLKILSLALCSSFVAGQNPPSETEQLVHLNIVYRHGDRAPVALYPNDKNNGSFWARGLGELTKRGCQMHHTMGNLLKKHYGDFITDNPREISVRSSDKDRCLDSASCHLAGMYRPSQDVIKYLSWQPVPIHARPNKEDGLLAPGNGNCPYADRAYELLKRTSEAKQFLDKYSDFYKNLTVLTGANVTDWESAGHIYDVVMIEDLYKLEIPSWARESLDKLSHQSDVSFVWYAKTPLLQRLRAGPLAKEILGNLKKASKKPDEVKIHMYSTHDTEVAALLQLYDLFDAKAPRYCATVIVELWKDTQSANFTVKIYYLSFADQYFKLLLEIPLSSFESRIAPKLPVKWSWECGTSSPFSLTDGAIAVIVALSTTSVFLVCAVCCLCCCRRKTKGTIHYSPLPTETVS